jgi:predicted Zn-dependent protease
MQKLEPPDSHHLSAAQGWLGLGDWISANQELDKINAEHCAHLSVLQVRLQIYAAAKQWAMAAGIARALAVTNPDQPSGWIDWAYALYELGRTNEARSVLLSVVDKFPKEHLIRYCLACYACQLGNLKEALDWLEKAKSLTEPKEVKELVLKNPYLKPLWNEIGGS